MKRAIPVIVLAALAAAAVLVWSQQRTGPFFVSGFVEAHEIRVGSRVGGRVAAVHVDEGRPARAGDVLVTLEPYDLQQRLAQAEAQLAAARAQLDLLRAGSRPEELAQAQARHDRARAVLDKLQAGPRPLELQMLESKLDAARADLAKAESDLERIRTLAADGRSSEEELKDATRTWEVARARHAVARDELALAREGTRAEELAQGTADLAFESAALDLVRHGPRSEEIRQAEAQVAAGAAAVAALQQQLAELTIVAPVDCVVEALDLQPGDMVAPNAPVASLAVADSLWVRAFVPENRLSLQLGQPAPVRVDAFPDRRFAGRVVFIARHAEFTPTNVQTPEERSKQVFRIKVQLDEGHDVLRPGMAADVFLEPRP